MTTRPEIWPRPRRPPKCGVLSLVIGLLFLFKALMCAFFRTPIHDLVDVLIRHQIVLTDTSMMTGLWSDPPITPRLAIHLFNVTNSEAVLASGAIPIVQEIGPYVYGARQVKRIHGWSGDKTSVTFQSRTVYKYLSSESGSGLDQDRDFIVVPNLILMTGMLKSEVRPQPDFIKKSVVWPILTSAGHKTPFVRLSVAEFLWGYEDELACLDTSSPKESENEDLFGDFGGFDDFFTSSETKDELKIENNKKKNYRQSDGRCLFGALVDKNATWETRVTMLTGQSGLTDKGRILNIGGSTQFNVWQNASKCDNLSGSREPSALPPTETMEDFEMLMGIMCRSIKMKHVKDVRYTPGVRTKRFVMARETLDLEAESNQCYNPDQNQDEQTSLPNGVLSVQKCCEGSPLAISAPHFLHADKWYREQVQGVSEPIDDLHELYIDIEPHLGTPVGVQARFQLNIVLSPDPAFPPLANLTNPITVLPIFWAQEGYDRLPNPSLQKLELALMLPNLLADGLIIISVLIGVILITWPIATCAKMILSEQKLHEYKTAMTVQPLTSVGNSMHYSTTTTSKPVYNALPFRDFDLDEEEQDGGRHNL